MGSSRTGPGRGAGWLESLLVGVVSFGLLGGGGTFAAVLGLVAYIRPFESVRDTIDHRIGLSAVAAAALVGVVAWKILAGFEGRRPAGALLAGGLVGVLAHPACWLVYLLVFNGQDLASAPSGVPVPPGDRFGLGLGIVALGTAWFSIATLVGFGWFTVPYCVLLGYLASPIAARRRRRAEASPWVGGPGPSPTP